MILSIEEQKIDQSIFFPQDQILRGLDLETLSNTSFMGYSTRIQSLDCASIESSVLHRVYQNPNKQISMSNVPLSESEKWISTLRSVLVLNFLPLNGSNSGSGISFDRDPFCNLHTSIWPKSIVWLQNIQFSMQIVHYIRIRKLDHDSEDPSQS